ncbi:MAG: hypothetical protein ACTSUG_07305 [Candidatus Helarchaeota archaeon]
MNKFSDWTVNSTLNRSFYILHEMLKREDINKIIFIDYLPVKRFMSLIYLRDIIKNYSKKSFFRSPFSLGREIKNNKLYQYSTILSVISWPMFYKELNKIIDKLGLENLILWSYYPLNVDYFDYVENSTKVIHIDDDWKRFKSLQKKTSIDYIDVLRKNYNTISNKADFIFVASDELLEIFMGHDNSYWIDDVHKYHLGDYNWPELVNQMFNKLNN